MYSGEATVSNDILNEVLRGGEVLKIRGLWRNHQTADANASSTPQFHQTTTATNATSPHPSSVAVKLTDRETSFRHPSPPPQPPPLPHHQPSIKENIMHHHSLSSAAQQPSLQLNSQVLTAEIQHHDHHRIVPETMSKESPVIVMIPRHTLSHRPSSPSVPPPTIFKKEICEPPAPLPTTPNASPSHYNTSMKKILVPSMDQQRHHTTNNIKSTAGATLRCAAASSLENGNERLRRYSDDQHLRAVDDYDPADRFGPQSSHHQHQQQQHHHRFNENLPRLSGNRHVRLNSCTGDGDHELDNLPAGVAAVDLPPRPERSSVAGARFAPRHTMEKKPSVTTQQAPVKIPEALSFLTIKEEPLEWSEYESDSAVTDMADKPHIEVTVKPEVIYPAEENITEEEGIYTIF